MNQPNLPPQPGPAKPADPMFKTLDKTGPLEKAARATKQGGGGWILPTILGVCILGLLGFCIYLAVDSGNQAEELQALNKELDSSANRIGELEEKLYKTENLLSQKIQSANQELSNLQEQHSAAVQSMQRVMTQKADKTEVTSVERKADNIKNDVGALKDNIQTVDSSVKQVDTKVVDLGVKVDEQGKTIEEQRKMIEQNVHNINATADMLNSTRDSLSSLKTSLDREYFVFQLHKKSGIIRLTDVGVRLAKTKHKEQRYDIEIFYDDQKLKKKSVSANEPIYFMKMGYKKPYEVVITKVISDQVNGYLSKPKVTD